MDQQDQRTAWKRGGNGVDEESQQQVADRAEGPQQGDILARVPDLDQQPAVERAPRRSTGSSRSRERSSRSDGRMISPAMSIKLLVGGGVLLVAAAIFLMNRGDDPETQAEGEGVPSWQPGLPAPGADEAPAWGNTAQDPPSGMFQPGAPMPNAPEMPTAKMPAPNLPAPGGATGMPNIPTVNVGQPPAATDAAASWNPPTNQPGTGVAPPPAQVGSQPMTPPAGHQTPQPAPSWDRQADQTPSPNVPSTPEYASPEYASPEQRYGGNYHTPPAATPDYRYERSAGVPETQANRGMTVAPAAPDTRYTPAPQASYPDQTPPYREDYRTGARTDDYRRDYNAPPVQNYPPSNYTPNNNPAGSYPANNYTPNNYPAGSYPANNVPANNYPANNYPANSYPQNNYPQSPYPPNNYTPNNYPQQQPTEPGVARFNGTIERPSSRTDYDSARPSVY